MIIKNLKYKISLVDKYNLILDISKTLKKELEFKEWINYVKTGCSKEKIPDNDDWYYVRSSSMLVYLNSNPVGLKKLRKKYGSMKNRGVKPDRKYAASGSVIRTILQALEKKEYLIKVKKGRCTTKKGKDLIEASLKKLQ